MFTAKDLLRFQKKFLYDRSASPLERACPYRPRPTDILISGARRSGTTWVQQILHEIRSKGGQDLYGCSQADIDQLVWYIPPYYEKMDLDLNGEQIPADQPRLYKTHESFEDAPRMWNGLRYVVVVRDPMDVVFSEKVSRYRQLGFDEDVTDVEDVIRPFGVRPDGWPTDTCWDHMISWWSHRNDPNVFWLHYEDLLTDLSTCIRMLAEFVNIPLSDAEVKTVHDRCTFRHMSASIERFSGRFLAEVENGTLGIKCKTPLIGGIRLDGGVVGQGERKLDQRMKNVVKCQWKDYVQPMTGHQSYKAMYADTSILARRGKIRQG